MKKLLKSTLRLLGVFVDILVTIAVLVFSLPFLAIGFAWSFVRFAFYGGEEIFDQTKEHWLNWHSKQDGKNGTV